MHGDRAPHHTVDRKSRRTSPHVFPATAPRNQERLGVRGNFFCQRWAAAIAAMAATQAASTRNFDVVPSNVTFAVSCAESRCLRTLRPFLTHFDPQRHCRPDGTRRMTADQSVPLRTGTGRRPEQTATSISTQYPQSRYTTINQADISVWHDTRFSKVPLNS